MALSGRARKRPSVFNTLLARSIESFDSETDEGADHVEIVCEHGAFLYQDAAIDTHGIDREDAAKRQVGPSTQRFEAHALVWIRGEDLVPSP